MLESSAETIADLYVERTASIEAMRRGQNTGVTVCVQHAAVVCTKADSSPGHVSEQRLRPERAIRAAQRSASFSRGPKRYLRSWLSFGTRAADAALHFRHDFCVLGAGCPRLSLALMSSRSSGTLATLLALLVDDKGCDCPRKTLRCLSWLFSALTI